MIVKVGIFTLVAAIFFCLFSFAFALEAVPQAPIPTPSPVNYALPYPGILPGHPLYFLKLLRDRILLFLIKNPVRQVEFRTLLADKRLNSAIYLMDQGKSEVALNTLGEATGYLRDAENLLFEISAGTPEINNLKDRVEKSLAKHQEVISGFLASESPDTRTQLTKILQDLEGISAEYTRKK